MKYLSLALLIFSFTALNTVSAKEVVLDLEKAECQNYPDCMPQAELCGYLAGIKMGAKVCDGAAEPKTNSLWGDEVMRNHCMGYFPIAHAMAQTNLEEAYVSKYQEGLATYKKAANCL